jgi:hypothetical protein
MPIPATTSADLLLRKLLDMQVADFDKWVSVEDLVEAIPEVDLHHSDSERRYPRSVQRDIEYLERHQLAEFKPSNPHVRLTPLGVYTALLFDVVSERT